MKDLSELSREELIAEIEVLRVRASTYPDKVFYYENLCRITVDTILLIAQKGDIIEVNDSACNNLGYTRDELLKMNICDIDLELNAAEFKKLWKDRTLDKQYLFETILRKKDGTIFPVEISASAFTENNKIYITGIARNISERKEAEEILLKNKAQLSNAMKIAQLGYWEYDVDEDYFIFNDQFYSIFRTTAKEVGGYKLRPSEYAEKFLHPDDMEIIAREMKMALKTEDPDYSRQLEHRIVYADGNIGYLSVHFFIVKDKNNRTIKTFGANQDITKRKKAELAVIDSENRLFAILNNLQGIAYKCKNNKDWDMEYLSAGCKALTGYDVEELIGDKTLTFNEIIHPDHREKVWRNVQEAVQQEKQYAIEYKIICKDKQEKWVIDRGSGIYDKKNNLKNLEGLITDITMLKKTEFELKKLFRAVHQAPALILITDKDGRIEYVNLKFSEVTGYALEELIGKTPSVLKSGKHPDSFYKEMWNTILSGKTWSGEIVNRKKNKELFWESALISPITDTENKITHFVAMKEDITEKKHIEFELIKAKEKAEESDKLKSAFLANMSHEIRTPLNGILGFATLLTNKDLSQENTEYYQSLIKKSSNQLLSIVNNIIEISKIESEQVQVIISDVNVCDLLDELAIDFEKDAVKKGLEFRMKNQLSDDYAKIETDYNKLRVILTNLFNNALKFTKSGLIEIFAHNKEGKVQIEIFDTGIGIDKNMYDKIFQRFRQVEETHTRQFGGTGLGLSISKAYIEMLGGKIWVKSSKGEGTTFFITLPAKDQQKKGNNKTNNK